MPDPTVENLMRAGVVTGPPQTTLDDVAKLMSERDASAFVVMDGEAALGVVLRTDLGDSVLLRSGGRWQRRTARDFMTAPVVSVPVEASLYEALSVLRQHRTHRLVVVGPQPLGILTMSDILHGLGRLGADAGTHHPPPRPAVQRAGVPGPARSA
jgi:CBS domain-containing protein